MKLQTGIFSLQSTPFPQQAQFSAKGGRALEFTSWRLDQQKDLNDTASYEMLTTTPPHLTH